MYVKDSMAKDLQTITPEQAISEAIEVMSSKKLHRIPVVDGNKKLVMKSGTSIALFPKDGYIFGGELENDEYFDSQSAHLLSSISL